jgi:hypothetical protein
VHVRSNIFRHSSALKWRNGCSSEPYLSKWREVRKPLEGSRERHSHGAGIGTAARPCPKEPQLNAMMQSKNNRQLFTYLPVRRKTQYVT